jgi:hypothetical protein
VRSKAPSPSAFRTAQKRNRSAPTIIGSDCGKLDLRKAPQVAKNDLTTLLINLRCAKCRRVCGQRYDPHDVNTICYVFFHPAMGYQLSFLKGRIYG